MKCLVCVEHGNHMRESHYVRHEASQVLRARNMNDLFLIQHGHHNNFEARSIASQSSSEGCNVLVVPSIAICNGCPGQVSQTVLQFLRSGSGVHDGS